MLKAAGLYAVNSQLLNRMTKDLLNKQLSELARIARGNKTNRLFFRPYAYLFAILYRKFVYGRKKKETIKKAKLFWGEEMLVALPSATDIYIADGKTHDSEIRLASFLIESLQLGDHFLDIGAHYGYFSRLAAFLTGRGGKVICLEPTRDTFDLLKRNVAGSNIIPINKAASDSEKILTFYEFSNQQSEYNSVNVEQFEEEQWFKDAPPKKVEVTATTIDNLIVEEKGFNPAVIKIDVEGAEYEVMNGGKNYLLNSNPVIVMEYLEEKRQNVVHRQAIELLRSWGYRTFSITPDGSLQGEDDIDAYLLTNKLDSDNIVLMK